MSFQLPVTIDFGALPDNGQGYNPQAFADRLSINGRIFTEQQFALFVTGATAPTSDVGPWAANGNEWRYYDYGTGSYVPFIIPSESLGYYVGSDTPDETIYQFWIQLAGSGSPLALKTYYSGAWVDVYATTLGGYLTTAAAAATYKTIASFNTDIAAYLTIASAAATYQTIAGMSAYATLASPAFTGNPTAPTQTAGNNSTRLATTAFVTAAIAALPPPASFTSSPAKAALAGPQTVDINDTPQKLLFASEVFDPNGVYDAANSRYVAPADGYYQVFSELQLDNAGGTSAAMKIEMHVYVNGSAVQVTGMSIATPPDDQWFPQITALVQATAGQFIEVYVSADDEVNSGDLTAGVQSTFSVNRVAQS